MKKPVTRSRQASMGDDTAAPTITSKRDDFVLPCRRCGSPAHWFDWVRASDGSDRSQVLCDAALEALCAACAVALDPTDLCACQHCQREADKLRRRS